MGNVIKKIISVGMITSVLSGCATGASQEQIMFGALGGTIGGIAGASLTSGINLAQGALIGAVAGGAYQAFTTPKSQKPVTYYHKRPTDMYQTDRIYVPNQQRIYPPQRAERVQQLQTAQRAVHYVPNQPSQYYIADQRAGYYVPQKEYYYDTAGVSAREQIFNGIVSGGIIGGTIGSVAGGFNFGQGAVIGAVAGGALQAINHAQNHRGTRVAYNYAQPSPYQPAVYRQVPEQRYRRVQMTRDNQYLLTAPAKVQHVPYYYSNQAGGYVPSWGLVNYQ